MLSQLSENWSIHKDTIVCIVIVQEDGVFYTPKAVYVINQQEEIKIRHYFDNNDLMVNNGKNAKDKKTEIKNWT